MRYIAEDATLRFKFNTRQFSTGAPFTLAGTPSLAVYAEDSATQITAGITLTVDYDSKTGQNQVVIDLSADAAYAAGKKYEVQIEAGTVDSVSVIGAVVYEFYIHAAGGLEALLTRGMLGIPAAAPDATGGVAVIGGINPIQSDVALWRGSQPNALSSGRVEALVGAMSANVMTAAAAAADFGSELQALITGGAYALSTGSDGKVRIVDGTGAGELDTNNGHVILQDGSLVTAKLGTFALAKTTNITGFNDLSAAQVNSEADTALSDYDPPTYTELLNLFRLALRKDAALATDLSALLTSLNADLGSGAGGYANTTDAQEAGRDNIGTNGAALSLAKGSQITGFNDLDAAGIRTAIGLASANLDTQLDALPTANEIRNAITGGAYALDTDANGRIRVVDGTGAGEINTLSGAIVQVDQLGTQAKADVNAEMVDCLNVDTYAEPGQGTPPATTTIQNRIAHLYKRMRNKKTQSSTEFNLFGDDGTTVDQKATVGESGGVVTFGELVTGP
jgi:hypothetical protein